MSDGRTTTQRRFRICLLTEYFYPDLAATSKVLSELIGYLATNCGFRIDVYASRSLCDGRGSKLPRRSFWNSVRIIRVSMPSSNRARGAIRLLIGVSFACAVLRQIVATRDYDLLLVGTNPPAGLLAARAYCRLTGTPYVYMIHDLYPDLAVANGTVSPDGPLTALSRWLQARWLRGAARVVVLGRCMKDYLMTRYGVDQAKLVVIPNWGDPGIRQSSSQESSFRRKHGLHGFVVLYTGNLGLSHGLLDLVEAAALAGKRRRDVRLVIVGGGSQQRRVASHAVRLGAQNVHLFPPVPQGEYADVLASADVCLVSLGRGTQGLAVPSKFYSYLAAGRPVIAVTPSSSEISRTVLETHCGVRVDPGDPEALAATIVFLADSPSNLAAMGISARRTLVERFTVARAAERYAKVVREAASQSSGMHR